MKAAVLREPGTPLTIEEIDIDAPAENEVLISTAACGVCRSDLHFIDGAFPHPIPTVPGHEASGVVEAVGSAVMSVAPGDHVVTFFTVPCGTCELCRKGKPSLCISAATRRPKDAPPRLSQNGAPMATFLNLSGYAEKMLVHENACVKIRNDMPLAKAALLGCAVVTGAGAVFNDSKVQPGESVAVIGCGGIGLAAINAAKIAGASTIVAIDPVSSKRDLALQIGATDVFDPSTDNTAKKLVALSGGGFDYTIECVGQPATAELAWSILKRGRTATILGMIAPGKAVTLSGPTFLTGKKLQGSLLGSLNPPVDLPRLVDLYLDGQLHLDLMIAEEIVLETINAALNRLRSGDSARSVIVFR